VTRSTHNTAPRALIAGLIGAAAMLIGASAASALEFAKHPSDSDTHNAVELKGKIEPGDAVALQAYIAKLPIKRVTTVYLDSLGGSFDEGMALGTALYMSPEQCMAQPLDARSDVYAVGAMLWRYRKVEA